VETLHVMSRRCVAKLPTPREGLAVWQSGSVDQPLVPRGEGLHHTAHTAKLPNFHSRARPRAHVGSVAALGERR
jgi:hypothetical protein